MSTPLIYLLTAVILTAAELIYFRIARRFGIVDRPNGRSSHTRTVLRGGGIIFTLGLWVWSVFVGFPYPWLLAGVTLAAAVSFIDDIHSLPDSLRLLVQFSAMILMFSDLDIMHPSMWWAVILALIVCVGASNIFNFMDGINGITCGYALSVLLPLWFLDQRLHFAAPSLIATIIIADLVFSYFNFRPKGRARCFAGDVGSIGIAYILLFLLGLLIMQSGDITYLIFLSVYGIDGCLTIVHRIMLHENLGHAHRKHAYQIMANELSIGHVKVSLLYTALQLAVSAGFICLCPNTIKSHIIYLAATVLILSAAYVFFMKKYYHLHEEYLRSLEEKKGTN